MIFMAVTKHCSGRLTQITPIWVLQSTLLSVTLKQKVGDSGFVNIDVCQSGCQQNVMNRWKYFITFSKHLDVNLKKKEKVLPGLCSQCILGAHERTKGHFLSYNYVCKSRFLQFSQYESASRPILYSEGKANSNIS